MIVCVRGVVRRKICIFRKARPSSKMIVSPDGVGLPLLVACYPFRRDEWRRSRPYAGVVAA